MKPLLKKALLGIAVALVPAAYAGMAVRKVPAPLEACDFQVHCEYLDALGMNLPFPQVSCQVAVEPQPAKTLLWSPARHAWTEDVTALPAPKSAGGHRLHDGYRGR